MTKLRKELNALVITLLLLLSYPIVAQTTFTESAAAYGLNISGNKDGGHAWADYDGDGDLDVLVLVNSTTQRNYLMRNNRIGLGTATFTNVQPTLVPGMIAGVPAERSAVWGDINNDGRPDFIMNSHGNNSSVVALQIFIQNPSGTFGDGIGGTTPITVGENASATITINPLNTEGVGLFDFEGDGDLDIYFDSHNYGIELLRNNYIDHTTHTIVNPAPASLYTHITTGNGSGVVNFGLNQFAVDGDYGTAADVNDDGWVDIFMRKRDEKDFFLNLGGIFDNVNGADLGEAANHNKGANGLWDLDNDGDLDAVWTENGETQIYRNDGPGVWTPLGGGVFPGLPQPADFNFSTAGTADDISSAVIDALAGGDIDNDGDIDIILVGNSRSYLYINQLNSPTPAPGNVGSGTAMTFSLDAQTFNSGANGEGTTMVDVDDDGDLDIYMNISGTNRLYINNLPAANRNNHLIVDVTEDRNPDGTTGGFSGRTAIGTNVLIKDCDGNIVSGLRQVNGAFGHGTQQSPLVHFGLPLGEGQTYLIEVHYPNLYNAAAGSITRLVATGIAQPSTIVGTNHYTLTTTDAESLQNPNPPDAVDDTENLTTEFNISVQISLFDNDSEPDGDNFFIDNIVQPAVGSVVIDDADAGLVTFTYTAGTAFAGTTFDYTITDAIVALCPNAGLTDTATVTINPPTPEDCTNGVDDDGDGLVDCDDPECNLNGNGYDWYFGQNAGLDFENAGGPVQVPSPLMNAEEGCSVRSDEQGNLLFYTDGTTVYNRNHQVMPNGGGLSGGPSATQSGVIVQDPGNADRYYVFYINNAGSQSYYATVDMTLNGGLGDVVVKNTAIQAVGGEKIAAWPHANGTDIWVILVNQNNIFARLLTSGGLGAAVTSNITSSGRRYGQMKFSPNGQQMAIAAYPNSFSGYLVQLVDFNNSTGQFSNLRQWAQDEPYGVEFSPNGDYLYITDMGWGSSPGHIYQYTLAGNTTGAAIGASGISILSANHLFASLQIAPDGKIYMATSVVGNNPRNGLAVINAPDNPGVAANAVADQITFTGGAMSRSGLPNIPAYQLRSTPIITVADITQTCFSTIELQVQAFGATGYQWLLNGVAIAGGTGATIDPDAPGEYQVEVTYGCETEVTNIYTLIGDNDNDCVDDIVDIDDDNDGILDTEECNEIHTDFNGIAGANQLNPGDPDYVISTATSGDALPSTMTIGAPTSINGATNVNIEGESFGSDFLLMRMEDDGGVTTNSGLATNVSFASPEIINIIASNSYGNSNINQTDEITLTAVGAPSDFFWIINSSSDAEITTNGNTVTITGSSSAGTLGSSPFSTFNVVGSTPVSNVSISMVNTVSFGGGLNSSRLIFQFCEDFDNDGIPNYLDLDSDNDGIPDNVEAQTTLGYTTPNADSQATYTANNGLNSAYLPGGITPTNTDGTDNPDYLDLDSDNEGGSDTTEAGITLSYVDTDGDGLDDLTDATSDYADPGGTIDNPLSGAVILTDTDGDATTGGDVDFRDAQDDRPDNDNDGLADEDDVDDDNDGILDTDEGCGNLLINGSFDAQDFSSTAEFPGPNTESGGAFIGQTINSYSLYGWSQSHNLDGWVGGGSFSWTPHTFAASYNGDQYIDVLGNNTHSGGVNNTISQTVSTEIGQSYILSFYWGEDVGHSAGSQVTLDVDVTDSGANSLVDQTLNTLAQGEIGGIIGPKNWYHYEVSFVATTTTTTVAFQAIPPSGSTSAGAALDNVQLIKDGACQDTDNDGVIDAFDLDSDNDGIFDAVEAGHNQPHTNGVVNGSVGADGLPDAVQDHPDNERINYTISESADDADAIPNFLDLDSDGDGIPDNVEAQTTIGYTAPSGTVDANGVFTNYTNGLTPTNTDGTDSPDYLDTDSDNEGANDTLEARINLSGNDTDNDGLDDATDATVGYSDPGGTIDDPLTGSVILFDADNDANTGGDVDFRDDDTVCTESAGIIVNEMSNGNGGSQDWIELLVVGDAANPTAPVDLTGWFIDDNNGDFEGGVGTGIARGSIVLGASFNAVLPGSLIVIYNQSDKDAAIPADDPTDSNGDGVYILPGNHASLSGCSNLPSTSNSAYLPCTGTTASWSRTAFRNSGDVAQTRRPDGTFYHGFSYGDVTAPYPFFPCGGQSFNLGNGGVGSTFAFQCGDWEDQTNFVRSGAAGRTPGAVNSVENQYFVTNVINGTLDYNDLNSTNNCSAADLSLSKTVDNSNPNQGDNITFTITITNDGPSTATNIEVKDIIPTDFTYNHPNFSTTQGTVTFNAGTREFEWDLGGFTLTVGDSISLSYTVTVDVCGEFVNQAEITNSSLLDPDSTPNNGQ